MNVVEFPRSTLKTNEESPGEPDFLDTQDGLPDFPGIAKLFADFASGRRSPWKRTDRDLISLAMGALTLFLADFAPVAQPADLVAKIPAPLLP